MGISIPLQQLRLFRLQLSNRHTSTQIRDLAGGQASEVESCLVDLCEQSELSAARVQGPYVGPGSF